MGKEAAQEKAQARPEVKEAQSEVKEQTMNRDLNDWAAERLLGRKRGNCHGTCGWGTAYADGTVDGGTLCDWCHGEFKSPGPCPAYPFAPVTLREVMQALSEHGLGVSVRYEPDGGPKKWAVMVDRWRWHVTDDPLTMLVKIAIKAIERLDSRGGFHE